MPELPFGPQGGVGPLGGAYGSTSSNSGAQSRADSRRKQNNTARDDSYQRAYDAGTAMVRRERERQLAEDRRRARAEDQPWRDNMGPLDDAASVMNSGYGNYRREQEYLAALDAAGGVNPGGGYVGGGGGGGGIPDLAGIYAGLKDSEREASAAILEGLNSAYSTAETELEAQRDRAMADILAGYERGMESMEAAYGIQTQGLADDRASIAADAAAATSEYQAQINAVPYADSPEVLAATSFNNNQNAMLTRSANNFLNSQESIGSFNRTETGQDYEIIRQLGERQAEDNVGRFTAQLEIDRAQREAAEKARLALALAGLDKELALGSIGGGSGGGGGGYSSGGSRGSSGGDDFNQGGLMWPGNARALLGLDEWGEAWNWDTGMYDITSDAGRILQTDDPIAGLNALLEEHDARESFAARMDRSGSTGYVSPHRLRAGQALQSSVDRRGRELAQLGVDVYAAQGNKNDNALQFFNDTGLTGHWIERAGRG